MMSRFWTAAALSAGLLAAPFAAFAQDSTAEGAAEPQAPAVGGDLDLGEGAAPAQPQGPRTYVKETFTDWQLQCVEVPEGQGDDICQMYQLLQDGNGASVAEVSIFQLEGGGQAAAGGTFIVPLETLLTQKLTIQVDGGQPRRYDFSFCAPIGCYARVGFTPDDIARFKRGALAKVTIVPAMAPDQSVTVDMSLSGFTAAYDATSKLRP